MREVVVYIAGPISKGDLYHNIDQAHEAGIALLKSGIPALVPHGSCFWGNRHREREQWGYTPEVTPCGTTCEDWYGMDLPLVRRCDAVLRLPGESRGADLEVAEAQKLGRPVFHSVDEVVAWATTQLGAA